MRKINFLFILTFCIFAVGVTGEGLGDECITHEDCEDIPFAICNSDDLCECAEEYLPSPNKTKCLPFAKSIGEKCEIAEQCSRISLAECLNNTCVLPAAVTPKPVSIPVTSKSVSIPVSPKAVTMPVTVTEPENECSKDSDCSSLLFKHVCKDGTCVVGLPSISPKSIDLDILIIGKPCSNDTECPREGAGCTDNLCKCKENFVPAQNLKMCLPKAKSVGDKCVETAQCLALNGSICENEKCTQKLMSIFGGLGEKIPALLIGSSCQTDNDCKHLTHALCTENVCQCKDNYITSVSSNACLEKAKKEGDPCEIDKQCEAVKGATCLQKKCVKPGLVGAKLGNENGGSTTRNASKLILASILLIKMFLV